MILSNLWIISWLSSGSIALNLLYISHLNIFILYLLSDIAIQLSKVLIFVVSTVQIFYVPGWKHLSFSEQFCVHSAEPSLFVFAIWGQFLLKQMFGLAFAEPYG